MYSRLIEQLIKTTTGNTRYKQFGHLAYGKIGFVFGRFGKSEDKA